MINWQEIIGFTSAGITVADYADLRIAIANRYKEIYGSDIDLSTGSADGIYVETYCLIINNILQSFKTFYSNLDVNTANGKYLDMLCALSNVFRKPATRSTATVVLTLDENEENDVTFTSITLSDINGNEWNYNDINNPITLKPGVAQEIRVECSELGPVRADAGWIMQVIDTQYLIGVQQLQPAELGTYAETDASLRNRRNQSLGASGNTVLEGLTGALLSIIGIQDVLIYNNDTVDDVEAKDTTTIDPHCVYIVIRRNLNIDIPDSTIGSIIYEKMTPGIMTVESSEVNGDNYQYEYEQYYAGQVVSPGITQLVNWKVCEPVAPKITIIITKRENFASNNNYTSNQIGNNLMEYLNNLQISKNLTNRELMNEVEYSDPLFRGRRTYDIDSIVITDQEEDGSYINQDTYYNYTTITIDNTTYAATGKVKIELS